jgi:hypothetical protein
VNWIAVHLRYNSRSARLELVTKHLSSLAAGSSLWFFADVPDVSAVNPRELLEVSLQPPRGGRAQGANLRGLLKSYQSQGLVETAWTVAEPMVLRSELFPVRAAPMFYLRALAIGSARAVALLRRTIAAGCPPPGDKAISTETLQIYRSFVPDRLERAEALKEYADWLERTLRRRKPNDLVAELDRAPQFDLAIHSRERQWLLHRSSKYSYEPILGEVAAELSATAALAAPQAINATRTALSIRDELLARLAHTHAVRLWGPFDPGALAREISIVRQLVLAEQDGVSSSTVGEAH